MNQTDAASFGNTVQMLFATFHLPEPSKEVLRAWWMAFEDLPFDVFQRAAMHYIRVGKYPPKPSDIREVLATSLKNQWLSAEEAWACAIKASDDYETVVWTEEAAKAFGDVRHLLADGNEFAARTAFVKFYDRYVDTAIAEGKRPEYRVSEGWDREKRRAAILEARDKGLLTSKVANRFLAELSNERSDVANAAVGMLTGNVVEHPSANAKRLADLMRETLAKVDAEEKAQMAAKDALREQRRQAMQDRKRQIVTQAESLAETMGASDTQAVAAGNSE
ncbi:hypothetical protein [Acidithiobacillus caldus]|uniref:hypothetical protein n=1 Tax=Acidithiobacillus caldus TaxID=33059 RepID=UPI001C06D9FF|nr:hypothetical protein [Acidithiobacillus caldus]MBU2763717.1 hypothetical protein [Acidithiobacillus caldus]MBU2771893.1 hypothetical protein [Acidithiobacillus caldus]